MSISIIISILSLIISIILLLRTVIQEQTKINIDFINYTLLNDNSKKVQLNLIITNESKLPVSISAVKATSYINYIKTIRYGRNTKARIVYTQSSKTNEIKQEIFSDPIPIKIDSYGSVYAYVSIDLIDVKASDFLNDNAYVEFISSRGPIKQLYYFKNYPKISTMDMLDFPG